MTQPQLMLTYFGFPARGELTRLTLIFGGIDFEDHRIDGAVLAELKPSLPLAQIPVLEVNGVTYAQSMALARYSGRLTGLYPSDPLTALTVDMLVDSTLEVLDGFIDINWRTAEDTKADKKQAFATGAMPKIFAMLEKQAASPWFLGEHPSIADLFIFDVYTNDLKGMFSEFDIAVYPTVQAIIAKVAANPNVAAYLAKHK